MPIQPILVTDHYKNTTYWRGNGKNLQKTSICVPSTASSARKIGTN
jgi:hypothetical protein